VFLEKIRKKIRLFFLKNKEPYLSLFQILGFYPNDVTLYEQAFLHRSVSPLSFGKNSNNERLEFLGDAILDAIIADIVFAHFPNKREGFLTNTRSKIVKRETLNQIALALGLDKKVTSLPYVAVHNKYLLGNALEALIGAVYLDQGYEGCRKFVKVQIVDKYFSLNKIAGQEVNFKSRLLEWSQKSKLQIEFNLIESFIDDAGKPVFHTSVSLEGTHLGTGVGNTKKESQQMAAKTAFKKINKDKDIRRFIEIQKSRLQDNEP